MGLLTLEVSVFVIFALSTLHSLEYQLLTSVLDKLQIDTVSCFWEKSILTDRQKDNNVI